ncbi:MAG: hypothetical protein M0Z40_07985, partial [Actinomycetota bacterium]|nr:hypothetical protein [Actinomycetota bacterium]
MKTKQKMAAVHQLAEQAAGGVALEPNEWAVEAEERSDGFVPSGWSGMLLEGFHLDRAPSKAATEDGAQQYLQAQEEAYHDLFARSRTGSELRQEQDRVLAAVARWVNRNGDAVPTAELGTWLDDLEEMLLRAGRRLGPAVQLSPVVRKAVRRQQERLAAFQAEQRRAANARREEFISDHLAGTIARYLHAELTKIRGADGEPLFGENRPRSRRQPRAEQRKNRRPRRRQETASAATSEQRENRRPRRRQETASAATSEQRENRRPRRRQETASAATSEQRENR